MLKRREGIVQCMAFSESFRLVKGSIAIFWNSPLSIPLNNAVDGDGILRYRI